MIRYRVPERVGATPAPRPQLHVTMGDAAAALTFAAALSTLMATVSQLLPVAVGVVAVVVLGALTVWALRPPRGVDQLYRYSPAAPREARERGHLATAVVEEVRTGTGRHAGRVTLRLLVVTPTGPRYRTTTVASAAEGDDSRRVGGVVAVRVHPDQRGVVVVVDEPPGPPPQRPSRPVPEYSGVPAPTRGVLLSEVPAALGLIGLLAVGALLPLALIALLPA